MNVLKAIKKTALFDTFFGHGTLGNRGTWQTMIRANQLCFEHDLKEIERMSQIFYITKNNTHRDVMDGDALWVDQDGEKIIIGVSSDRNQGDIELNMADVAALIKSLQEIRL